MKNESLFLSFRTPASTKSPLLLVVNRLVGRAGRELRGKPWDGQGPDATGTERAGRAGVGNSTWELTGGWVGRTEAWDLTGGPGSDGVTRGKHTSMRANVGAVPVGRTEAGPAGAGRTDREATGRAGTGRSGRAGDGRGADGRELCHRIGRGPVGRMPNVWRADGRSRKGGGRDGGSSGCKRAGAG